MLSKEHFVDASSDGWRKKACEQADALLNVMALTLSRAHFYDAINCSDMRKDATAIEQFLPDAAAGIVGETEQEQDRLAGWVLNNTKANCRAMLDVQIEKPKWIGLASRIVYVIRMVGPILPRRLNLPVTYRYEVIRYNIPCT
jgi:hypothetical protein